MHISNFFWPPLRLLISGFYCVCSLVRQHLEYAVQAWNPHVQGEIDKIERVQRTATRISFGFEKLVYKERLKRLCLTNLKNRRLRGDLIEMYIVMNNKENINWV